MSALNYVVEKLKSGVITFVNMVTLANRDYPYHDTQVVSTGDVGVYVVGDNNVNAHGNQSKRFVSKSTLIMSTAAIDIYFNDSKNVAVSLVAGVWYEFKSNIWQVFYDLTDIGEVVLYLYFEGVLPNEARSPH